MVCVFFASLTTNVVTDQIIVDYVRVEKSKDIIASLGVINLVNEVMPLHIVSDKRLWNMMLKIE